MPAERHVCRPEGGTRRTVGACVRADRPDQDAAPMTVAVCACGADVTSAPGQRRDERTDEQRLRDAVRARTQTASATTPDDVADLYRRRMRGFE